MESKSVPASRTDVGSQTNLLIGTRGSWLLPAPVTDPLRLLAWLLGAAVRRLVMLL